MHPQHFKLFKTGENGKDMPLWIQMIKNEKKKLFIHMATHESLLGHLKPSNHMLITTKLYLFSSLRWMKKSTINFFERIIHFLNTCLKSHLI